MGHEKKKLIEEMQEEQTGTCPECGLPIEEHTKEEKSKCTLYFGTRESGY